jgi:hypothetical protein
MKLLLCVNCQDVIRLIHNEERTCLCGRVKGKYLDEINAVYSGDSAIPIGFNNSDLSCALQEQPKSGMGKRFEAFVIPQECLTFKKNG